MKISDLLYALAFVLIGIAVIGIASLPQLGIPMATDAAIVAGGGSLALAGVADLVALAKSARSAPSDTPST